MRCLVVLIVLAGAVLAGTALAQPLTLSGEIRHRSEVDDRDLGGAEGAVPVHLLRTRLAAEARPAPRVRAVVQIQDARLWGSEDPALALGTLDGSADGLDLHQAFFELDSLGGQPLALRVGRQELAYGNQRLVGAVGWSNVGRSFDAARLRWTRGRVTADVFAAQLVTAVGPGEPQSLAGAFATVALGAHTVEGLAVLDRDATRVEDGPDVGTRRRERATAGVRAHGRLGRLGLDAELYGQTGTMAPAPGAPRNDVRAWLGSATATVGVGPVDVALGATRLSGDANPDDGTDRRFDTLFATNHKFYGAMDYFPRSPTGLDDVFASIAWAPGRWRLAATAHAFAASVPLDASRALGRELDVSAAAPLRPGATVAAGVSVFDAAERLGGGATGWGYLTATVTF